MQRLSALCVNMTKRFFIHIDADAFFASVEQCLHRELRNKPIVTGRDGSIAVALSYEAKALGVKRATPIHIIRKEFPNVQMVASDYYMYRIYSDRMIAIIQEYIPHISRKSIDECSAEITDSISSQEQAQELARTIQKDLQTRLLCTFSIGVSTSPLLAKMASGMNKPAGLTLIDPENDTDYHNEYIKEVSGLGARLCERLSRLGVIRISDFIKKYPRIRKNFSVAIDDIFYQIQGIPTHRIPTGTPQKSMNRARSFKVTNNKDTVFGQLILHFEHLTRKMRSQSLTCQTIHISLRNAERISTHAKIKLPKRTRDMQLLLLHINILFRDIWKTNNTCRYISLTFSGLSSGSYIQSDIFNNFQNESHQEKIFTAVDILNGKFGKPLVTLASGMIQPKKLGSHIQNEKYPITHTHPLLLGESEYKRLQYPFLGVIN